MEAMIEGCAGLDVHQETVVACILVGPLNKKPEKYIKTFNTTTKGLLELNDWLFEHQITDVEMESTGVYWKPVWNILEGHFKLTLANAKHIKNVPGRKTDVNDAEWIAKLLRCVLIEGSFVPPENIRDLRDLTRYRKNLIQDRTQERNRIHKILQDANIKLTTYITDIFGVSGRNILEAIMNGEVLDENALLTIVKGASRKKIPQILEAIHHRICPHHRLMLRHHWEHIQFLDKAIDEMEREIDHKLKPYHKEMELLTSIPGVSHDAAVLIAEMGVQMEVFQSEKHLASWAGLFPGNNESAGKRKTGKTTKGNKALKTICVKCALATQRQKNRISAHRYRIMRRQGKKKVNVATAHLILRIAYQILKTGQPYQELGYDYFTKQKKEQNEQNMIKYLSALGYQIEKK
ncbi:IS110 family RNA-guided transposase [Parageobacillus toebii]|uniref:Uncharacterized protein n=1 Tax=Parageobacillus toebii TaxID=153151 RepID=A0A150MQN4_9BACL|nr:IS110 family transposase [Parageobacillus toebii]KYD26635.1 hypothetical protein B4110_3776 [Parageobacillus toebii]